MKIIKNQGFLRIMIANICVTLVSCLIFLAWMIVDNNAQTVRLAEVKSYRAEMSSISTLAQKVLQATLAAMDTIVDRKSAIINAEREEAQVNLAESIQNNREMIHQWGIRHGMENDVSRLTVQFVTFQKAVENLWNAVKSKESSDEVFDGLDDRIDQASQNAIDILNQMGQITQKDLGVIEKEFEQDLATDWKNKLIFLGIIILLQMLISLPITSYMHKNLNRSFDQVNKFAKIIRKSSGDLSQVGTELSQSVHNQNAATNQSIAAMTEIQSIIRKNVDFLSLAREQYQLSSRRAEEGQQKMNGLSQAVQTISQSQVDLANMVEAIENMSEKTKKINTIVLKTQILSFNASIEAAKAGAQGKGFSVVASEVGRLADMSGQIADEIEANIRSVMTQVRSSVDLIKTRILDASNSSHEASENFEAITASVSILHQNIDDMVEGINQQKLGVDECVSGMNQLGNLAHKNSNSTLNLSQIVNALNNESGEMENVVTDAARHLNGSNTEREAQPERGASLPSQVIDLPVSKIEAPSTEANTGERVQNILSQFRKKSLGQETNDSDIHKKAS